MENNNWIVMKFGGTSVSTRKSWQTIGDILQKRIQHGHRVLLVCSAVAGMTNALEQ